MLTVVTAQAKLVAYATTPRFACVVRWDGKTAFVTDADTGLTTTVVNNMPGNSVPLDVFGYDDWGYKPATRLISPDGRYTANLLNVTSDFMLDTSAGHLSYRLLITDNRTRRFFLVPEPEVVAAYWSPDGQHIAYLWIKDNRYNLTITDPDGANRRSVALSFSPDFTDVYGTANNVWSSDGAYLVFAHQQDNQLSILSSVDLSVLLTLTLKAWPDYSVWENHQAWAWSRQGHQFAYWDTQSLLTIDVATQHRERSFLACLETWNGHPMAITWHRYIASIQVITAIILP